MSERDDVMMKALDLLEKGVDPIKIERLMNAETRRVTEVPTGISSKPEDHSIK